MPVFLTHLQSKKGDASYTNARMGQLQGIESLYQSYTRDLHPDAVFTAGDFNVSPFKSHRIFGQLTPSEEWSLPAARRFFTETNSKYSLQRSLEEPQGTIWDRRTPHTLWDPNMDLWHLKENEIDHIVAWRGAPVPRGTVVVDRQMGRSSDHVAVAGTFLLRSR